VSGDRHGGLEKILGKAKLPPDVRLQYVSLHGFEGRPVAVFAKDWKRPVPAKALAAYRSMLKKIKPDLERLEALGCTVRPPSEPEGEVIPEFTAEECAAIVRVAEAILPSIYKVVKTWNGAGARTFSVSISDLGALCR
jgi:hypothetical protein